MILKNNSYVRKPDVLEPVVAFFYSQKLKINYDFFYNLIYFAKKF